MREQSSAFKLWSIAVDAWRGGVDVHERMLGLEPRDALALRWRRRRGAWHLVGCRLPRDPAGWPDARISS